MAKKQCPVALLREQYPPGTRVRLDSTRDPYNSVEPGTVGTVELVDDIGTVHAQWDSGQSLGLIPGEDSFSVVPLQRLMLYMPIHGEMPGQDIDNYLSTYAGRIGGHTLLAFKDIIEKALVKHREPEEVRRGLMRWYGKDDGVNAKVYSAFFGVEERAGSFWGTVTCMVEGELTAQELKALKEDIESQASDGWGEGFAQKDLITPEGILYVHLWDSQDWQLMTEAEFSQRYEQAQALEL